MIQPVAIRRFPSQEEARDVALKLEEKGIASRVATDQSSLFNTLYVASDDSEAASEIIGSVGVELDPTPDASDEGSASDDSNASSDPLLPQVLSELDRLSQKEKSPWKNLGTLIFSLILFAALGLFRNSFSGVAILIGVLFIHESGHFIGMKLLKYRDIQMFFIPLFGAAVSGKETEPSDLKKAIVSLLGPAPGILIGIIIGVAFIKTKNPLLADISKTFLFLNTFNLVPLHPLDGGRFFDAILFSRHPKLELGFKIITILILAALAFYLKEVIFGVIAFFVLITLRGTYLSATIAYSVRKQTNNINNDSSDIIPPGKVESLIALLRTKLPEAQLSVIYLV